jgi:hypothetical protein
MDVVTMYNLRDRIEPQKESGSVPNSPLSSDERQNNVDQTKELEQ